MKSLMGLGASLLATACAHTAVKSPPPQLPALSIPVPVIRGVCDRAQPEHGSGHFDGHAQLLWSKDGSTVVAIECSLTVLMDGLSTTAVRIYLDDPRARALRDLLESRGH